MSRNNDLIDDKENRLQEAINYYHQHKGEKGYSIRFVADYFGVCDTTLLRRLAKKTQFRKGRPPALSKELEDLLAETIIHLAEMGFGMAKFEVCEMTQYHLETNPDLKKKYRDFKFGEKWIDGYLHRYPNISLRTSTNVQASRAVASYPKSIDKSRNKKSCQR